MANVLLAPVYKDVYGEQFSSNEFSNRMQMQKLIYLLQEAGISIGDYNFHWYKHGPYSQQLQDDILKINCNDNYSIRYSETARNFVSKISDVLNRKTEYSKDVWAECLASLQYLRSNVFSINATDEDVVNELQIRKPHLSNTELNKEALEALKVLYK